MIKMTTALTAKNVN